MENKHKTFVAMLEKMQGEYRDRLHEAIINNRSNSEIQAISDTSANYGAFALIFKIYFEEEIEKDK